MKIVEDILYEMQEYLNQEVLDVEKETISDVGEGIERCMEIVKRISEDAEEIMIYNIDKVVKNLSEVAVERYNADGMGGEKVVNIDDAIEIVKQGGVGTNDVCEWKCPKEIMDNKEFEVSCNSSPLKRGVVPNNFSFCDFKYCPYCGKKIKVVD